MTDRYVIDAVLSHVERLEREGTLTARPVRLDGFTRREVGDLVLSLTEAHPGSLVHALSRYNNEPAHEINAERATRYRNLVDAAEYRDGFLLLVPLGQVVESSLDEPAFMVIPRAAVFRRALSGLRDALGLTMSDLQAIRQASRYRQPESLFGFLSARDVLSSAYPTASSHAYLGLLEDSELSGSWSDVIRRLQLNWQATDILLRPGASSSRTLDDLVAKIGLDTVAAGPEILALQRWWRGGRTGESPAAINFGTWPIAPPQDVDVRWEPDLSHPPHTGFRIVNERTEVESVDGTATIEWTLVHKTPATRFELELIEDASREVIKPLAKTKLARRQLKWASVFKDDEVRQRIQELNPVGELEGYMFRIRLKVFDGPRWIRQEDSEPFVVDVLPRPAAEARGAAATAYHALYEFHTVKAADPRIASPMEGTDDSVAAVRLVAADGKEKEARLDISRAMLEVERAILGKPTRLGPWHWRQTGAGPDIEPLQPPPEPSPKLKQVAAGFLAARRRLFSEAISAGSIEACDLLVPGVREVGEAYVTEYESLLTSYVDHSRRQGSASTSDRQDLALLLATDCVEVVLGAPDQATPFRILLVLPTHPATVAWLLDFQSTIFAWTRGRFDPDLKPAYRPDAKSPAVLGGVENFTVGPRSMVLPSPSSGPVPEMWGFAGNLTATWQCFIPVGADLDMRARDWTSALVEFVGLSARPVGSGPMDPRRIGSRIKKYAVLHPYVSTLRLAAVFSGEGGELLEALRVIDERPGTPKGAQTVRDIRYDVTLIGPESERFGRAIDQLTLSPGDDRWSRYASAVLDNPETLLVPGFAYAKRPIEVRDGIHDAWARTKAELDKFGAEGLHVTLIGPMLATSVGVAPAPGETGSFRMDGLAARPVVRAIHAFGSVPFEGNWLLSLGIPLDLTTISLRAAAIVSSAVDVSHGVVDAKQQVGLEIALSGSISAGLRTAHDVSDWVIIADPLFSIELLDRAHRPGDETLLLDFTPEFDPYPGGRVVVSTRYLREIDALGDAVASALSSNGVWTSVLESISARLLLALANPTKQVVHGLAGLALSRVQVALAHPRSLVVPIDGHEDMFVFPQAGHGNVLADLLAVRFEGDQLVLQVVESKWTTKANLSAQVDHGVLQATTTSEAIRASYLEYPGVDRRVRFDNLREILLFHVARADRHDIHPRFSADELRRLSTSDELLASARVESTVLVWCPDGSFGSSASEQRGETTILYFDGTGIDAHERAVSGWPMVGGPPPAGGRGGGAAAISELITETLADDLEERHARESADATPRTALRAVMAVHDQATGEVSMVPAEKMAVPQPRDDDRTSCVRLGSVVHGRADALWCPPQLSNGHLIIIGGSGAGKTTALRHISAEIIGHGVPVLIIDFHGDIDVPGDRVATHEFDYSANATFVNPFHLDPEYGTRLGPSRLKWEFLEAWKSVYPTMGVHQTNFLASLIEEAYARAGISEDPESWNRTVTFGDVLDRFDSSDVPDALRAKIESYMKRFLEWRIFHGGRPISVESFLERPTRLDLSQLDESARNILADVVLRRLFLLVRALGPLEPSAAGWSKFRAYVVIDEAQVLMGSSSDAKASLTKYAAEARKFGIGLILATQLRDNVPTEIWGNIDTRLFMQALDQAERARNARAANVPESMLRSLARGEAILLSSSQPNAAPVVVSIEPSWLR